MSLSKLINDTLDENIHDEGILDEDISQYLPIDKTIPTDKKTSSDNSLNIDKILQQVKNMPRKQMEQLVNNMKTNDINKTYKLGSPQERSSNIKTRLQSKLKKKNKQNE